MSAGRDRSTEAVIDEAAQWVVRMAAPGASLEDKREFVLWLKRSPVHLGEYLRLEGTWADLGDVDTSHRVDVDGLLAAAPDNVLELGGARQAASSSDRSEQSHEPQTRSRARYIAVALAAVLVLAVGVLWFLAYLGQRYSTGVGEQRTVRLDDGSTVVLNTSTKLQVAFAEKQREVQLLEGEALFNVARDVSRPFLVVSDRAIAQAVGTSFIVRRKEQQTVVTVIEGTVAVTYVSVGDAVPALLPQDAVRVSAGARADVADGGISMTAVENPGAATAWRSGQLVFDGETLAQIVAEFNRYNELQIVLTDPQLSNERLSGVFDASKPQALVRFLERSGVIEPARQSGNDLILVPQR
jgi:transmembrane sensor